MGLCICANLAFLTIATVYDDERKQSTITCSVEISLLPILRLPSHPKAQKPYFIQVTKFFLSPHVTEMVSKVRLDGTIKIIMLSCKDSGEEC